MEGLQMHEVDGPVLRIEDEKDQSGITNGSTSILEEAYSSETTSLSRNRKLFIMSAIYLSVFLAALDTVIVPTALPTITVDLDATDTGFAWIGATHMLSAATSLAIWNKISDIFGRKSVLLAAKIAFLAGSISSALCTRIAMLFVGRALQGVGGAGIIILGNRLIIDLFDEGNRAQYLAFSGVSWSLAMAVAPIVGGSFVQAGNWRWCFWINLPGIAITLLLILIFHQANHPKVHIVPGLKAIDWLGTLTLISGTILVLLGLEMGGVQFPWHSAPIILLILIGISTLILFVLVEWKIAPQPLFPLQMFRNRSAVACLVICAAQGMAFLAHLYFIPCYFQTVLEASPTQSGLWSFIMTGTMAAVNVTIGIYLKKRSNHTLVIRIGAALMALGLGLFINFPPYRSWTRIVPFQIIVAVGLGMLFQPPLIALQKSLPTDDMSRGTSAFLFLRPVSYGISAVVGQLLLQTQMKARYQVMVDASFPDKIAAIIAFEDTVKGTPLLRGLIREHQQVVMSAMSDGLDKVWVLYTVIAFIGFAATFLITDKRPSAKNEGEDA